VELTLPDAPVAVRTTRAALDAWSPRWGRR
jgi:hypothetical protein